MKTVRVQTIHVAIVLVWLAIASTASAQFGNAKPDSKFAKSFAQIRVGATSGEILTSMGTPTEPPSTSETFGIVVSRYRYCEGFFFSKYCYDFVLLENHLIRKHAGPAE